MTLHAADLPDGTVVIDGNTTVFIRNHPTRFAPWRHTGGGFSADWQVDEALRRGARIVLPVAPGPAVDPISALHAEFTEMDTSEASSNDVVQMLDDWFVKHGHPTVLYRDR